MDDANLPSLLSSSLMGYVSPRHEIYLNTRQFALSEANPYWAFGDAYNAIGGPHLGPTKGWPIASIVRVMTSEDASGDEIRKEVTAILGSTDGLGGLPSPPYCKARGIRTDDKAKVLCTRASIRGMQRNGPGTGASSNPLLPQSTHHFILTYPTFR